MWGIRFRISIMGKKSYVTDRMGILGPIFSRAERHSTVLFFAIFMYRYPRCTGKQSANASPLPRDEAGDGRSLDCWAPSKLVRTSG